MAVGIVEGTAVGVDNVGAMVGETVGVAVGPQVMLQQEAWQNCAANSRTYRSALQHEFVHGIRTAVSSGGT